MRHQCDSTMKVYTHFGGDDEGRLSLAELEALYYDLVAKDYIRK